MRIFRLVLAGAGALVAGPLVLQSNAWAADPAPVYGTSRDNDEAFPGYFLDEHYARLSAAVSPLGECPAGGWTVAWSVAHAGDEAAVVSGGPFASVSLPATVPGATPIPRSLPPASVAYSAAETRAVAYPTSQTSASLTVSVDWLGDSGTDYVAVSLTLTAERSCTVTPPPTTAPPTTAPPTTAPPTTAPPTTPPPTVVQTTVVPSTNPVTSATVVGGSALPETGPSQSVRVLAGLASVFFGFGILTLLNARRRADV